MAKLNKLPSLERHNQTEEEHKISETVRTRHIHVWSAGGDGTVMSVFEMLVSHKINLDSVFFSCIPFGTGNDFSQVLGWGRTIPHKDILGKRLTHLEELITERLQNSEAARLDIWQIEMSAFEDGYVRLAGPERKDGHDVLEIDSQDRAKKPSITKKMSNYMSIGVQGYVGSGFEKHRAGNRLANMLVYTIESAKWVFWRRFPSVTGFIDRIVHQGQTVLSCSDETQKETSVPTMTQNSIDVVIQNIPHIWGREVDLWGETKHGLEVIKNRSGPTDPEQWTQQLANDGKLEIMAIENMRSYIKELANLRNHVFRVGQFSGPFEIEFCEKTNKKHSWFDNSYKKKNVICIMCDGEFYIIKNPKALKFKQYAQIWTLGRNDDKKMGRLVQDEQAVSS
ncbi:ATP-NAD kinase-like domain-containing protein [Sporodiniella umbellata]|nr:ATP-NAD kinase-like domain-containing protein [Sporodiniella umbellata]